MQLIVPLATAFADDGTVDVDAAVRLAQYLHGLGVEGFVIGGTTGEGPHLLDVELRALCLALNKQFGREVTIAVGSIRRTREDSFRSVDAILAADPDALLLPPPPGADPGQIRDFYADLHRNIAGRAELWAYHLPAKYPPGIDRSLWPDLSVDAFKDSTGDGAALAAMSPEVRSRVYIGASTLAGEATRLGCRGVILASANIAPQAAVKALAGDEQSVRELVDADRELKSEFPASLKRLVGAQVDFPSRSRATPARASVGQSSS